MMKKTLLVSALTSLFLAACGGGSTATQGGSAPASDAPASATSAPAGTAHLNIYNWSDYVDPETITAFEKENGVTVRQDFYDSNETLEAKVLTGKSGYDLVGPGISNVGRQIQAGAYLPLDKSQIPNYDKIDPELLKLLDQVDPGNQYAVPYFWGINTVGINQGAVEKALGGMPMPDNAWDLVFNPEYTSKLKACGISFFDSPSELFPLALHYLGKDPNSSSTEDLQAAADLLKKVRGDVKRFSSSGYIDDMARGDLCVVTGYNGDLHIAQKRALEAKKDDVKINVLLPKTGVGVWLDTWAIPKDAVNVVNAHKYINYTLDPKVAAQNGNFVTYAPGSKPARELMEKEYADDPSIFPTPEVMAKSFVILPKTQDGTRQMVRLWQQIKASQ